ncbi:hypothetical protein VNI00_013427 [Paramarasmius palmivorus]|uniref:Uncharacterized protein n=1 Tax=Paramarasmius palmivorus TaxID=297713 RepID=A0AAW0C3B3_9AGAR
MAEPDHSVPAYVSYDNPRAQSSSSDDDRTNRLVLNYVQFILHYIGHGVWNEFRALQVTTGTIIAGIAVLGCFTKVDADLPMELFVIAKHAPDILQFLLDAGYTFKPSMPESMWPADWSDIIWEEVGNSNTPDANMSMYTRILNKFAHVANVYVFRGPFKQEIRVVATNYSPFDLIFAMPSTRYMNFITGTHMFMLFPRTTLHQRATIDFEVPQGVNFSIRESAFFDEPISVNPFLTALHVL